MLALLRCAVLLVLLAAAASAEWHEGDTVAVYASFRLSKEILTRPRALPQQFAPKYGQHRVVTIDAFHAEEDRRNAMLHNTSLQHGARAHAVLIRFPALETHLPWLPLRRRSKDMESHQPSKILGYLTVIFTTRQGLYGQVTQVNYRRRYVPHTNSLTIEYVWREEPSQNPDRAVLALHVVGLVFLFVLSIAVTADRRLSNVLGRVMVVKDRSD